MSKKVSLNYLALIDWNFEKSWILFVYSEMQSVEKKKIHVKSQKIAIDCDLKDHKIRKKRKLTSTNYLASRFKSCRATFNPLLHRGWIDCTVQFADRLKICTETQVTVTYSKDLALKIGEDWLIETLL